MSVSKDGGRIAIQSRVNQVIDTATAENVVLPGTIVENGIESELFVGLAWQSQDQVRIINAINDLLIIAIELVRLKWATPHRNFDPLASTSSICISATVYAITRTFSINESSLVPASGCSIVLLTPWFANVFSSFCLHSLTRGVSDCILPTCS